MKDSKAFKCEDDKWYELSLMSKTLLMITLRSWDIFILQIGQAQMKVV